MTLVEKINEHWEVLKTIEDDLILISKYIKFDRRNFSTYSVELSKILIFICSEVESIYKIFSEEVYKDKANNINGFKSLIIQNQDYLSLIETFRVEVGKSIGEIVPWINFSTADLLWWKAYNRLKHEYIDNLIEGSLNNVINSVAGMYALLVCLQIITNTNVSNGQAMIFPVST